MTYPGQKLTDYICWTCRDAFKNHDTPSRPASRRGYLRLQVQGSIMATYYGIEDNTDVRSYGGTGVAS
jgi:hypothetical protein